MTYVLSNPKSLGFISGSSGIRAVVEQVMRTGIIVPSQEELVNQLLMQQPPSEEEMELLDRLCEALLTRQVVSESEPHRLAS
jgi:hypothetical protein